ncbi:hypothetical protein [Aphanothece stagnina]|uniref:hypothetical protein n=1 Tax=Aphanothece stagnina TaxID=1004305 RepID=UPI00398E671A
MAIRQKFATQVETELLDQVRELAAGEGRQIQSVVEEALKDWIEKKSGHRPRPEVIAAYHRSVAQYHAVYEELAK